MKKTLLFSIITLLVFTFFVIGCKKEEVIEQPNQKSEMIPIAKLTDKNEIEHLFLQKDVQALFAKANSNSSKENSEEELIFVEVIDYDINDDEAGLLYRIYDSGNNMTETSISMIITLEDGIYYLKLGAGASATTVSCTTTGCTQEVNGCVPRGITCTPCQNGGVCTRTVTEYINGTVISAIIGSINYAN